MRWIIGGLVIFLIALFIRLPFFGQVPSGLNRDEAALGYNAYSLLKTGTDEYGHHWPVSITSFGDQKLPGYVYLLIPFIAHFSLSIWSVRLPSLIAGLVLVIAVGQVGRQLAQHLKWSSATTWAVSMLSMLFIAVAPWANHFSRVAYEANVALACFVVGFIFYQAAILHIEVWKAGQKRSRLLERICWALTALAWSGSILTYHSYHIFVPLMLMALTMIDWRKLLKADRIGLGVGLLVGVLTVALLFHGGVIQANQIKSQGITPFRQTVVQDRYVTFRHFLPGTGALYGKFLFNGPFELATIFSQNYLSVFSADFFFIHGSGHGDHNPGHLSNMHLYIAPFLVLGFLCIWQIKRNQAIQRIAAWFFLAAIPAALTIQPQHEIRLSPIFPVITLIAALGCVFLFQHILHKWLRRLAIVVIAFMVLISSLRSSFEYLNIVPKHIQSNEHYHLLAKTLIKYQPKSVPIITNNQNNSPYIWYLFESKYDPKQYLTQVEKYKPDAEGFIHVKRINNIYFQDINWDSLSKWADNDVLLLVLAPRDFPDDKLTNKHLFHLEDIKEGNGQIDYQVWEWNNYSKVPTLNTLLK